MSPQIGFLDRADIPIRSKTYLKDPHMDFGDEAQLRTEQHLETQLKKRKTLTVPFSGSCLSCDEPVGERRFCDSDCREDWEKKQKLKAFS